MSLVLHLWVSVVATSKQDRWVENRTKQNKDKLQNVPPKRKGKLQSYSSLNKLRSVIEVGEKESYCLVWAWSLIFFFTWHPPLPWPPAHTIDFSSTGSNLPFTLLQALCSATGSMACWRVSAALPPPTVLPQPATGLNWIKSQRKCLAVHWRK